MKARIIVIDDDADLLEIVSSILKDEGYVPIVRTDAHSLEEDIRSLQPKAVLLDINLPGENGDIVAARLKRQPTTAGVPIVLMSADIKLFEREGVEKADAILPKPFEFNQLLTVLHDVTV